MDHGSLFIRLLPTHPFTCNPPTPLPPARAHTHRHRRKRGRVIFWRTSGEASGPGGLNGPKASREQNGKTHEIIHPAPSHTPIPMYTDPPSIPPFLLHAHTHTHIRRHKRRHMRGKGGAFGTARVGRSRWAKGL